jgi:hypothetical protein
MSIIDLLKINNKIIINTDIDGVLSGLLLQKYAGCEIVGFSNSDNAVWINQKKINSIYDAVYIDMFVADPNVVCIDQHIVTCDEVHWTKLKSNSNKINPNIILPRHHAPMKSYRSKYPLGVLHFIIALLEKEGIQLEFNFNTNFHKDISLLDLFLRADDAMNTSVVSNFKDNAILWWNWFTELSRNGKVTSQMISYLNELNEEKVVRIKQQTSQFLKSAPFYCESSDGGYKSILNDKNQLHENVLQYFSFLAKIIETKSLNSETKFIAYKGKTQRISLTPSQKNELMNHNAINGQKIFSYAFIWGENREGNFSYTVM